MIKTIAAEKNKARKQLFTMLIILWLGTIYIWVLLKFMIKSIHYLIY